ncbi:hypothetical protein ZIOFF_068168 [Zingiber officinale]|uniref:Uncharacterized protein n=1 Tax=Zingiber officinale TaxID=94328 RepID=A0A8J5EUX9_ZINOF|nr:hypothetical protein ZIOFF_068168 [Zingiber officinale]
MHGFSRPFLKFADSTLRTGSATELSTEDRDSGQAAPHVGELEGNSEETIDHHIGDGTTQRRGRRPKEREASESNCDAMKSVRYRSGTYGDDEVLVRLFDSMVFGSEWVFLLRDFCVDQFFTVLSDSYSSFCCRSSLLLRYVDCFVRESCGVAWHRKGEDVTLDMAEGLRTE